MRLKKRLIITEETYTQVVSFRIEEKIVCPKCGLVARIAPDDGSLSVGSDDDKNVLGETEKVGVGHRTEIFKEHI